MGLDYSYLLYFNRDQIWEVLEGVLEIAEHHQPPIQIHFPGYQLAVPLQSWTMEDRIISHDDLTFSFATVLFFKEDDEISDYLERLNLSDDRRGPPDEEGLGKIGIGYIYLTIYNDISSAFSNQVSSKDLVLFDFGTTGTKMSTLFAYSPSIRNAFLELLHNYHGVCGVFNRESDGGEVLWFDGHPVQHWVDYPYDAPIEIGKALYGEDFTF